MSLRENVIVDTPVSRHEGILVLLDGLPALYVSREGDVSPHTPQTFPACWRLSSTDCGDIYTAWRDIEAVMDRLRDAQREAEEAQHA